MRVTQSMYYDSIYGTNNNKLSNELFDVNKQIASGLKIQYASDDVATFVDTMRLDNEITTLKQVKKSTESGYKVSNQSDTILNDFTTGLDRTKTLFIQAANGSQSNESLDAIAKELRGLESHFKNLANTSINGKYLFSGTATDTKPINDDGSYNGNAQSLNALIGNNNKQQYNLSGAELFLGEDSSQEREVSSNTINRNLLAAYPDLQLDNESSEDGNMLTTSDTIRNLMGDTDNSNDPANTYHFYLRGTQSDGTSFNKKIELNDTNTIGELLDEIGKAYGNADVDLVDVHLNNAGEIVVTDKQSGSSKLDFHMVGAVDFDTTDGSDEADINDAVYANSGLIENLDGGETNFDKVVAGSNDLYIKEFVRSDLKVETTIQGLTFDRAEFTKEGSKLSSNAPQILKKSHFIKDGNGFIVDTISDKQENTFAQPTTLLSEVADTKTEIVPSTDPKTYTLDGTKFNLEGTDIHGDDYSATINLASSGSTFEINGNTYNIYDMKDPNNRKAVPADEMTYQQLMDVMNMLVTNNLPTGSSATDYDDAIKASKLEGNTSLSYDGKLEFTDLTANNTKSVISLYDANAGNFDANASVMTFNTTNALTVRDPKTDFFKSLDQAISAVEEHKLYPDATTGTTTNVGIQNAIQMIDDLREHVSRSHAKVGAQSNALNNSIERTTTLETNAITLRSSVIDTDIAEASLRLSQLNLNYQAMLSTIGKVSKLSLVNYL